MFGNVPGVISMISAILLLVAMIVLYQHYIANVIGQSNVLHGNTSPSAHGDGSNQEDKFRYHVFTDDELKRFQNASAQVPQDDKLLVQYFRNNFLQAPSMLPLRLASPATEHYSQRGQSQIVDRLLNKRMNGFFIECGAANGEMYSNSLFFEKERNWTGLLIEANTIFAQSIVQKRRHSYHVNACLSPAPHPMAVDFKEAKVRGGIPTYFEAIHSKYINGDYKTIQVQCFPLYSMMIALGRSHIDYFSLDVEGPELDILRTLPLDKLRIDVLSVEYLVMGRTMDRAATARKLQRISTFFADTGLYNLTENVDTLDVIYIRKDLHHSLDLNV